VPAVTAAPTYAPGNAPVPYGGGGSNNNPLGGKGGRFSGLFISSVSQVNSILIAGAGGGCYGNGNGGGGGGTTGQNGGGYWVAWRWNPKCRWCWWSWRW
jgi:hypothetical protein